MPDEEWPSCPWPSKDGDCVFIDEPDLHWVGQYILGGEDGHEPIPCLSLREWGRWIGENDRLVAWTGNPDKHVSTVFLGLDHRYFGDGPPLVFESMAFIRDGDRRKDIDQDRYGSWAAAEAGHKRMVEKWLTNAETRVKTEE
jgi:hypothetical protein